MSPQKKRTDIYNLNALAEILPDIIKNKQQKLMFLFKDVDLYMKPEEIKQLIKTLDEQHKNTIKWLKGKI